MHQGGSARGQAPAVGLEGDGQGGRRGAGVRDPEQPRLHHARPLRQRDLRGGRRPRGPRTQGQHQAQDARPAAGADRRRGRPGDCGGTSHEQHADEPQALLQLPRPGGHQGDRRGAPRQQAADEPRPRRQRRGAPGVRGAGRHARQEHHPRAPRRVEERGRPGRRGGQGAAERGGGEAEGAAQPDHERRAGAAMERGWLRGRRRVDAVEVTARAVAWWGRTREADSRLPCQAVDRLSRVSRRVRCVEIYLAFRTCD
mmetsp:Transcript_5379/g.13286  ORF Transcript_5379/g.13286 Transcript_5379/m.13286 type:complete len:256 (-) Transcript_5379:32-799(-)